jgi:hypothetical protein
LEKLNIRLTRSLEEIDFNKNNGKFLVPADIAFMGPMVKTYTDSQVAVLRQEDRSPFSLNYVL